MSDGKRELIQVVAWRRPESLREFVVEAHYSDGGIIAVYKTDGHHAMRVVWKLLGRLFIS